MNDSIPFRAQDALETDYAPKLRGRLPYWRPKAPAMHTDVHLPVWNWQRPDVATLKAELPKVAGHVLDKLVEIDANAAWPSAASSASFAHGALEHTRHTRFTKDPGYWLVDVAGIEWPDHDIVSPLGTGQHGNRAWLATPTVALLEELVDSGHWPTLEIRDSWTCPDKVRLSKWADAIKTQRNALTDAGAAGAEQLEDLKVSYAMAVEMMLTGEKCKAHRPDWSHTIKAQSAASIWRKVWRTVQAGHGPVAMHEVDAAVYFDTDLMALQAMEIPPIKIDPAGRMFGTFKVKSLDVTL